MKHNPLIAFLQEGYQRLSQKSPKFFKTITLINYCILLLTGIPELLTFFDIEIYGKAMDAVNKVVAYASFYGALISKLTVANPDTASLPFTKPSNDASDKP
jgi:hypothetical protein